MRRKVVIVLSLALGAVLAVGGYSLGATKTPPVVHACVSNKTHVIAKRVGSACPGGTTGLSWDQQGPAPAVPAFETVGAPVPANGSGPIPETSSTVLCPTGWTATGGGFNQEQGGADAPQVVTYDGPYSKVVSAEVTQQGWEVKTDVAVPGLSVFAVCENP